MTRGEKIRMLRLQRGLTLKEVGEACGVSRATVCKWEKGIIDTMKADKIQALAAVLEAPISYILDDDPPLTPAPRSTSHPILQTGYLDGPGLSEVFEINPRETNPFERVKTEGDIRHEEYELLKIYRSLELRDRVDLLHYAFNLQGKAEKS